MQSTRFQLDSRRYLGHDKHHGQDNSRGRDRAMRSFQSNPNPGIAEKQDYFSLLADHFRRNGWRVKASPSAGDRSADLAVSQDDLRYLVELKVSSEGRRDRLVPLLSQAILQARAIANAASEPVAPLAIVTAPAISPSVAEGVMRFLAEVAPDAAAGIFDREGLWRFVGPGLERLNAAPSRPVRRQKLAPPDAAYLFSDLNQWMLKVLLAPFVAEELLRAPRREYRNASELASAADVSVMSAFRLVRQLRQEGFLDSENDSLRLVRREELMRRWQAVYLRPAPELPLRWIIPARDERRLPSALSALQVRSKAEDKSRPRVCLGLFAAAESFGLGFVHGVPPCFYMEKLDRTVLGNMGLSPEGAELKPDVFVRVPAFRESVYRAAVERDGARVADILQVWLDVSSHPARGDAQAEEIRRRALAPIFEEKR